MTVATAGRPHVRDEGRTARVRSAIAAARTRRAERRLAAAARSATRATPLDPRRLPDPAARAALMKAAGPLLDDLDGEALDNALAAIDGVIAGQLPPREWRRVLAALEAHAKAIAPSSPPIGQGRAWKTFAAAHDWI